MSTQQLPTANYMLNLAATHPIMPVLRSEHKSSPLELVLLDSIHICPILEQCAGTQIMTILGSKHQRIDAICLHLLGIRLCLEQCADDLIEMV